MTISVVKKACQRPNRLARLAPFMNVNKRRIIMKAFTESQFGYCLLVWMFHNWSLDNNINRKHKTGLEFSSYEIESRNRVTQNDVIL